MAMGIGNRRAEINVTPLIDVLLVLLIIFMVIQPQRSTGLDAKVPQPAPANAQTDTDQRDIVVAVSADLHLEINTQPVAWEDLENRLRTLFATRPNGVLFVAAAESVEFLNVATVIDTARGIGIGRVALMPRDAGRP
jgi:biopolymer transport protein TolR